jgi:hypothetical protein
MRSAASDASCCAKEHTSARDMEGCVSVFSNGQADALDV